MSALGISMALLGLGAQAFGMKQSADANNALRTKLLERSGTLDDVFKRDMSMDYMETPGFKNTLSAYGEKLKDISKNSEGRAVMAGSSPEAVIAEKQAINENYGDFIRKLSSGADQFRADKERAYMVRRDQLDNQIYASDMQRASQWDNLIKNAGNLAVAGISAGAIQDTNSGSGDWLKKLFSNTAQKNQIRKNITTNIGSSTNNLLKKNMQTW